MTRSPALQPHFRVVSRRFQAAAWPFWARLIFSLFRRYDGVEACGMAIQRIAVLCSMFFLVALSPHVDAALAVIALGVSLYSALWLYEIFMMKGK